MSWGANRDGRSPTRGRRPPLATQVSRRKPPMSAARIQVIRAATVMGTILGGPGLLRAVFGSCPPVGRPHPRGLVTHGRSSASPGDVASVQVVEEATMTTTHHGVHGCYC